MQISSYLPEVRLGVPRRGVERRGHLPGLPEQPGGAAEAPASERREGRARAGDAGVQLWEEDRAAETEGGCAGADGAWSGEDAACGRGGSLGGTILILDTAMATGVLILCRSGGWQGGASISSRRVI